MTNSYLYKSSQLLGYPDTLRDSAVIKFGEGGEGGGESGQFRNFSVLRGGFPQKMK